MDVSRLAAADREEWFSLRTARRRRDWASSRALAGAVRVAVGQSRSLSHSRGYAALAVGPGDVSLGVDIEWLAPRDFRGMAGIAFSSAEAALIDSLDDPDECRVTFYELWTLKEAFAKALGLPLLDALRQCCFVGANCAPAVTIPTARRWLATVFAPRAQLRLAVVRTGDFPSAVTAPLHTLEWPPARTAEWSTVRCLSSDVNCSGHAC